MQCDAEHVDRVFAGQGFDLVYSSNMLTHTPDHHAVLTGVAKIMSHEGVLIIVVPSPLWKLCKEWLSIPACLEPSRAISQDTLRKSRLYCRAKDPRYS